MHVRCRGSGGIPDDSVTVWGSELPLTECSAGRAIIDVMIRNLTAMGVTIVDAAAGLAIEGNAGRSLHGAGVDAQGTERVALALAVAGLLAAGTTLLEGVPGGSAAVRCLIDQVDGVIRAGSPDVAAER